MNLEELTDSLNDAYKEWKTGEKSKNDLRDDFFEAITDWFRSNRNELEERYVSTTAPSQQDAEDYFIRKYPRWDILELRPEGSVQDLWEAIIVERPEYKAHTFVNHSNGMVFTKQVSSGSIYVDDERLQQDDPELWEAVSYVPEPERQLRSLEELEPDLLAKLAEYMYEGKPQVKLAAPRKAKPEELG